MSKRLIVTANDGGFLLLFFSCSSTKKQTADNSKAVKSASDKTRGKGSSHGYAVSNSSRSFSESLGLTSKQVKHSKLYSFCDEWYGVPYRYGGCRKSGIDCSCFVNML